MSIPNFGIEQEYQQICNETPPPKSENEYMSVHSTACHSNNFRVKNRYTNVLPVEETRVRLEGLGSDYINANLVKYVSRQSRNSSGQYVCTQAPLPATFGDFWWMVWQCNSPVICALNRLQEGGKVKGDLYWPCMQEESQQYDSITVTLKSSFLLPHFNDIEIRLFRLENQKEEKTTKYVFHLCYTGWPDFGVPASTAAIRELIYLIKLFRGLFTDGPCIVHCSAGLGRTGTFLGILLAFDTTLPERIFKKQRDTTEKQNLSDLVGQLEICDIVISLRKQRNRGIVQTVKQYEFIYKTLKDEIEQPHTSNSEITAQKWVRECCAKKISMEDSKKRDLLSSKENDFPPTKKKYCEKQISTDNFWERNYFWSLSNSNMYSN